MRLVKTEIDRWLDTPLAEIVMRVLQYFGFATVWLDVYYDECPVLDIQRLSESTSNYTIEPVKNFND